MSPSTPRSVALATALALLTSSPLPALACGMGTHGELAHRALYWFDGSEHAVDYGALLSRHQDAFQAGAPFPDWGYACGYHDAGEDTHWQPFLRVAAQYVHDTYPQPWDADTEKLVAWLLGTTAHSISDINWHGLGVEEGFIDMLSDQDFHGDWGTAHSYADTGGDMVAARDLDNDWLARRWYVPVDDIDAIYKRYYGSWDAPPKVIERCLGLFFLATFAEDLAGSLAYPYFVRDSATLEDAYADYFMGGLDDMAIWSSWAWEDVIGWIEGGDPTSGDTWWASHRRRPPSLGASHDDDVRGTADLAKALGLRLVARREGRGVVLEVDPSSVPPGLRKALDTVHAARLAGVDLPLAEALAKGAGGDGALTGPALAVEEERRLTAAGYATIQRGRGDADFTVDAPYAYLGRAMAAGDFNGDGREDLALSAYGVGGAGAPQEGAAWVVYGGTAAARGAELPTTPRGDFGGDTLIADAEYSRLGFSLATVDLNADGYDDLAVGAPTVGARALAYTGEVRVYFGGPSGLSAAPDVLLPGSGTYTNYGHRLRSADVDGDGAADLIIGAPFARSGGRQRGGLWVFLAEPGLPSGTTLLPQDAAFTRLGTESWGWLGWDAALLPTEDGRRLLLVSAPGHERDGQVTVGRVEAWDVTQLGDGIRPEAPTFTLDGDALHGKLGAAIAVGAPLPDHKPLVALGSPTADDGDTLQAGEVGIYDLSALVGAVDVETLTPVATFVGDQYFTRLGFSVALDDLDGDGMDELIAGAPLHRIPTGQEVGATYVWDGGATFPRGEGQSPRTGADLALTGDEAGARMGETFLLVDLDGDGQRGLALASPRSSAVADFGGGVFLIGD